MSTATKWSPAEAAIPPCSNPNSWTLHANYPVEAAERQLLPDFDAHHAQLCGRHAEHDDHQLVLQHIWVQPTNHHEVLD